MAGITGSLATAAVSLLVLPALLGAVGRRIDTGNVRRLLPGTRRQRPDGRGWHRLAMAVMRRPVAVAIVTVAALGALAVPFAGAQFGLIDHRVLPDSSPGHQAAEDLRSRFTVGQVSTIEVVMRGTLTDADLAAYANTLSHLPHVEAVHAAPGTYRNGQPVPESASSGSGRRASDGTSWLTVVTRLEPTTPHASTLVEAVRASPSPAPALVTGEAATLVDTRDGIADRLPAAAAIIVLTTVLLLFALTGSVLVPLKAIVLAALSLTATFGALVLIFQDGYLRDLFGGFTVTGWIDITAPVLMFCVAYGLAMDYEVFLISRIQEEHTRGGDNTAAVATGLQRTGRLVTAAAVLIAVVLGALATSGITYLKMLGVGLALAVLVDAFIVRALLVPALMRLAGDANWWAPAPLRRLHARLGLRH
jgi:RND superfamily putative drug exporter